MGPEFVIKNVSMAWKGPLCPGTKITTTSTDATQSIPDANVDEGPENGHFAPKILHHIDVIHATVGEKLSFLVPDVSSG